MNKFTEANRLIERFKGSAYLHNFGVLAEVGAFAAPLGKTAFLVCDKFPGSEGFIQEIIQSLTASNVKVIGPIPGAPSNAPVEDVIRIQAAIAAARPDFLVSFGGGSTIDAVKAANILDRLGGSMDDYFGTGLVTQKMKSTGQALLPHLAIQTAASSGAHLTKYSNITNLQTGQKKLVVDEAVVPVRAVFDYRVTFGAPPSLTADGALDGLSHALEVLFGSVGKPAYDTILPVSLEVIRLVITYLPLVLKNPLDEEGRMALGLATDLGGYAIMLGGTNGSHLTSFSLIDILSHGRACALLNPYYTVFFAPAIQAPLQKIAKIFYDAGISPENPAGLSGRKLGSAVARDLIAFQKDIGFPTTLSQVQGFTDAHIERALTAAKDPQLKMKLENMPVPMSVEMVDIYMRPILIAAKTGNLDLVKNVE